MNKIVTGLGFYAIAAWTRTPLWFILIAAGLLVARAVWNFLLEAGERALADKSNPSKALL